MKVCVVGLGSMGKRRIRLLQSIHRETDIYGIDLSEERCRDAERKFGIKTSADLSSVLEQYHISCAFICTAPLSHAGIITLCLEHHVNVFTELNLVPDDYEKNMDLAKRSGCILFLSSTMMYRAETEYMKNKVRSRCEPYTYTYHIGQYLPDWHPWESFHDFFISDKRTNGCRELFAVELPWIVDVFGPIRNVKAVKGRTSALNISYADTYLVLIEHEQGHRGALCIDVVCRKAVRNLEIYSENTYIHWNGTPDGLFQYDIEGKTDRQISLYDSVDKLEGYSSTIIEDAYLREIINFFSVVEGKETPRYSFQKDLKILEIIDQIEGEFSDE